MAIELRLDARRLVTAVACVLMLAGAWLRAAQSAPPAPAAKVVPDTVQEHYRSAFVVAADGGFSRETEVRLKVNTEDGVKAAGTLRFEYERDMSTLTVRYVRVRKPDGTVVETPVASAIDVPAAITRDAPAYTDVYERHINVRGLAIGDVVEYVIRADVRPMFPGHLGLEEEWGVAQATTDGEVTLSAPLSMALTVKTHDRQPAVTEVAGRRLYRWTFSHPEEWTADEVEDLIIARRTRRAAVQVSTFGSWRQAGEAVRQLWRGRAEVTPAIREKAAALTQGKATEAERIAALLAFVSRDVRYVQVSFGVGRLQPHVATEVLGNGFGDCKDKHVLLEALLRAVDIESAPVLVAPGMFLDTTVPSPLQFTHVITRVNTTNGFVWLDATVAPIRAGYLPFVERDHDGLLVPTAGAATIVRTPAEGLEPSGMTSTVTGTLDAKGTLTARVEETATGDLDFGLRLVLRQLTEPQRAEMLQRAYAAIGRNLSDIQVSALDDLSIPLRISGAVVVANYSEWTSGRVAPLLAELNLPPVPTGGAARRPISFGTLAQSRAISRIQLPPGYDASVNGKSSFEQTDARAFAAYRLTVAIESGVLVSERDFDVRAAEVSVALLAEYEEFRKVAVSPAPFVVLRDAWPWNSVSAPRFENRAGKDSHVTQLISQAQRSSPAVAVDLLQKAVELEPTHPSAWSLLGEQMTYTGKIPEGEATMRRQITVAPSSDAFKRIGVTAMRQRRWSVAVGAFREGAARYPDDRDMPAMLGEALITDGKFAEAAVVLQAEADRRPRSSRLQLHLGRAYLRTGQTDKGVAALHAAAQLESGPNVMAFVAYELSAVKRDLPRALDYADRAIKLTLAENETSEISRMPDGSNNAAQRLAFYYEAFGRVLLAQGTLNRAQIYCEASWDLGVRSRAAECLQDLATAREDVGAAERYRSLAKLGNGLYLPAGAVDPGPEVKLNTVLPRDEGASLLAASRAIAASHSFTVTRPAGANGTGFFELLTGPDGKVREARMYSSPGEFEVLVTDLLGRAVGPVLPEDGKARLLRTARVVCSTPGPQPVVTMQSTTQTKGGTVVSSQRETAPREATATTCNVRIN